MTVDEETQRTSPLWSFRLLAVMHFFRCISFLYIISISLIYIYQNQYLELFGSLSYFLFIPTIFVEMLCGFLFLSRRVSAAYIALFYYITGILPPSHLLLSFFSVMLIVPFLNVIIFEAGSIFIIAIASSLLIEIILLVFLGLNWINKEWVRDSSE